MLRSLRDGAKSGFLKYILLGFMALAVGGLVLSDVGGFFRGGGISSNYVAKGHGIEITTREFDKTLRQNLSAQNISPQQAYQFGIVHQLLQQEVQKRVIMSEINRLGLRVNDEDVTKQISALAENIAPEGLSKRQALQQILRSQGISEAAFVESIRSEMSGNLFAQTAFQVTGTVSNETATAVAREQQATRNIEGFSFLTKAVKNIPAPDNETLQAFYEEQKANYAIEERRTIKIATLDAPKDMTIEQEEELNDTANLIDDRLAGGEDFDVVVEEMKLKTKTFKDMNRIGLNPKNKDLLGAYVGEKRDILEQAFDYEEGETSPVFPLRDGAYIAIHISKITPQSFKPFKSVQSALRKKWTEEERARLNNERVSAALAALKQSETIPGTLEGVSKTTLNKIARTTKPKKPLSEATVQQLFAAPIGEPIKIAIDGGTFVGKVQSTNLAASSSIKSKEIETTQQQLGNLSTQEAITLYISNIAAKKKVKTNDRMLATLYGDPES